MGSPSVCWHRSPKLSMMQFSMVSISSSLPFNNRCDVNMRQFSIKLNLVSSFPLWRANTSNFLSATASKRFRRLFSSESSFADILFCCANSSFLVVPIRFRISTTRACKCCSVSLISLCASLRKSILDVIWLSKVFNFALQLGTTSEADTKMCVKCFATTQSSQTSFAQLLQKKRKSCFG